MYNFPENVIVIPTLEAEGYPGVHKFPFGNIATYALPNNGLVAKADDLVYTSGHYVSGDGVADNASVNDAGALDIAGKTLVWKGLVQVSSLPASAEFISAKGSGSTGGDGGWGIMLESTGKISGISKQDGLGANHSYVTGSTVLTVGVWHEITVTFTSGEVTGITVDGNTETLTVNTSPTGTYGDSNESFRLFARSAGGTASLFFAGDLADISLTIDGTLAASWLMGSNDAGTLTGLPEFDRSGNENHLTYTGCTSVIGEGPDEDVWGLEEYGEYMWFDGVDDNVSGVSIPITNGSDVSFYAMPVGLAGSPYVMSGSGDSLRLSTSYSVRLRISTVNYSYGGGLEDYALYLIRIVKSGGNVEIFVNGSSLGSQAVPDFTLTYIGGLGANYYKGLIYGITSGGLPLYNGNGISGSAWEDQINSNDGTVSGNPLTVADKLRTVPQTGLLDWNKATRFNGSSSITKSGGTLTGDFTISGTARLDTNAIHTIWGRTSISRYVIQFDLPNERLLMRNDSGVLYASSPGSVFVNLREWFNFELSRSGTTVTLKINGSIVATINSVTGSFSLEEIGSASSGSYLTGYLYRLSLNGTSVDLGNSLPNALLPASLSSPSVDALGNPIADPRKNLLNHTGWDGDRAVIPYDPSLNVTTEAEWFIWGNFYIDDGVAQIKRLVDRWYGNNSQAVFMFTRSSSDSAFDGKVRFYISTNGTSLTWSGSFTVSNAHSLLRFQFIGGTSFKVWEYNSGSWTELTVTTEVGSLPASLYSTDLPIYLPGIFSTNPLEHWEGQQSPLWMYNRILTDDEADDLRKATQSTYGTP